MHHHNFCGEPDCCENYDFVMPRETVATPDAPLVECFVGGSSATRAVLEFMPLTGAATPSLKVTITPKGKEPKLWSPEPMPAEYVVKKDFDDLAVGTRVLIEVNEVIARIRWFETVRYHHH